MSFIFDDQNLIEQLLSSGLQDELKFTKKGQAAAGATDQNRATLLQHIKNLQDQLQPSGVVKDPNAGPTISHNGATALGSPQLESLGDLVQWLANNGSKVDGQLVASAAKPADDENYTLYKLETHTNTPQQRGQDPAGLYVNADLLKKYITSLQAEETSHPNAIFQKELSSLIEDANQALGLNIPVQYQAPEKVLPDAAIVDNVPQIIDPNNLAATGNIPLTYGDLKNTTAFTAWLSKFNVSVKGNPVYVKNPNYDFKKVVDAIVARAQYLITRAVDVASKEGAEIYARAASALSGMFGEGKTSPATSVDGSEYGQPQRGVADQQGGPNHGQGGPNAAQAVAEAVAALPFASRDINFDRIKSFFQAVRSAVGNDPRVNNLIAGTIGPMNNANAIVSAPDIFPLGGAPEDFARQFKDQQTPGRHYFDLIKYLYQVISNARMVAEYFWYLKGSKYPEYKDQLIGQIGETPQDDSLYQQNVQSLNQLNSAPTVSK